MHVSKMRGRKFRSNITDFVCLQKSRYLATSFFQNAKLDYLNVTTKIKLISHTPVVLLSFYLLPQTSNECRWALVYPKYQKIVKTENNVSPPRVVRNNDESFPSFSTHFHGDK